MRKRDAHKRDLVGLFAAWLESGDDESLRGYILSNSNLPGPRANLELADAFMEAVEDYAGQAEARLWGLCVDMAATSAAAAPVNSPQEFLPFCGAVGIACMGSLSPAFFDQALASLRRLANDPRWRMREAVRMGLQRLLARRGPETRQALAGWIAGEGALEMRAAAAAVAEPALLDDEGAALLALRMHQDILAQISRAQARKSEEFRVLRKALGYTLSLVVRAAPRPGFAFMTRLAASQDPDLRWIVRENLRKSRLVKNYPEEVEAVKKLLNAG